MNEATCLTTARGAWSDLPDWVEALARTCDLRSQAAVARELQRSPSLVNMVLRGRYPGDLAGVEELVRGALMNGKVSCPALGELRQDECVHWREKARKFQSGNPLRTRMYRSCQGCARFQGDNDGQ